MTSPRVSVLMPVYNGERFLREAVESILNQTFTDFEFIIVDDGSTDGTKAILDSYTDPRIVRLEHSTNQGLVAALNRGLHAARGEYVARQDADDISDPERIEKQVCHLDRNSTIGILGTHVIHVDEQGLELPRPYASSEKVYPSHPYIVHWKLFFECPIAHPTVVLRRVLFERLAGYDPQFTHAEDYELWLRASMSTDISNIPEMLTKLRSHPHQVTHVHSQLQKHNSNRAVQKMMTDFVGREISYEQVKVLRGQQCKLVPNEFSSTALLLIDLYRRFSQRFEGTQAQQWLIEEDIATRLANMIICFLRNNPKSVGSLWRINQRLTFHIQMMLWRTILQRTGVYSLRYLSHHD